MLTHDFRSHGPFESGGLLTSTSHCAIKGRFPRYELSLQSALRFGVLPALLLALLCNRTVADPSETKAPRPEKHWAFVPPISVSPPRLPDGSQAPNPIDAFILAKLQELNIKQVGPAAKPELLRRVTYDLTGLLPSISELKAFLADDSAEAWDRVVDRL